jgi:hypothetical protein
MSTTHDTKKVPQAGDTVEVPDTFTDDVVGAEHVEEWHVWDAWDNVAEIEAKNGVIGGRFKVDRYALEVRE